MKWLIVLSLIACAACEHCYQDASEACGPDMPDKEFTNCNARYGKAENYIDRLNVYLNMHITRSLQYLLMSSHFGGYQMERDGFKKLFRKLSDVAWEDAFDVVKYVSTRGGKAHLKPHYYEGKSNATIFQGEPLALSEMESLAKAVDIQKKLAEEAHSIYKAANEHDPELGGFVEDKFMHKHAETIRELVGYTTELKRLVKVGPKDKKRSVGLQVFILDEYLNKHL